MTVEIPDKVELSVEGLTVSVKGEKGKLSRTFKAMDVTIEKGAKEVNVKGERSIAGAIESHINNMFTGVSKGYSKNMRIVYSHFPITVETKGEFLLVKNFLGEKMPRKAHIIGKTKVDAKGKDIVVSGIDKEDVGQTVANIREATKIRGKDPRVFQDGIYVVE
jgi:large subunit ribosomal protein L6